MVNKLWMDIQSQPENLRSVIRHLLGPERSRLRAAARFLQNDRPITFVGIGSAGYLCGPSEVYLAQHGRAASVVYASDALYNRLPALRHTNVVINSRSGETVEVVRLGQVLAEQGTPFLTITNEPDSTLAKLSTHLLWANSRKDDLVSINIVTSMMVTTLALAAETAGTLEALTPALEHLPEAMQAIVVQASALARPMAEYLRDARPVYLLYRGGLQGAAYNGRLVLEEIARTPGIAMEAGDFRQGPNEVIDERFGAVMFVPRDRQGELNLSLSRDILGAKGRVVLVGKTNGWAGGGCAFPIPEVPDELLSVVAVVPVQALAYELAASQGIVPGAVRYISKIIRTEEGLPSQTAAMD